MKLFNFLLKRAFNNLNDKLSSDVPTAKRNVWFKNSDSQRLKVIVQ